MSHILASVITLVVACVLCFGVAFWYWRNNRYARSVYMQELTITFGGSAILLGAIHFAPIFWAFVELELFKQTVALH